METKLYVGNLAYQTSESDLQPLFEGTAAERLALRYQPSFPIAVDPVFPDVWIPETVTDSAWRR